MKEMKKKKRKNNEKMHSERRHFVLRCGGATRWEPLTPIRNCGGYGTQLSLTNQTVRGTESLNSWWLILESAEILDSEEQVLSSEEVQKAKDVNTTLKKNAVRIQWKHMWQVATGKSRMNCTTRRIET